MRGSRFSKEQMIGSCGAQSRGQDGAGLPRTWDLERDLLQVESKVRRARGPC